jgi:hypothetical protein
MTRITNDISSKKKTEDAPGENGARFRVLAELTASAIFAYQGNRLLYVNPATEQ